MKLFVTTIYDHISKSYTLPSYVVNTGVAVRAFVAAANDKSHLIGQHPGDFSMFVLGEWDDELGEFKVYPVQQSLGLAASYVKTSSPLKVNRVQSKVAQKSDGNEALVQQGAAGGNSSKQLRPESRSQDDV